MITFGELFSKENEEKCIDINEIGIKLYRHKKCHNEKHPYSDGKGCLKDLQWCTYIIETDREEWSGYTYINIMPYKISMKEDKLKKLPVYASGVSLEKAERPHVAFDTGNIHPQKQISEGSKSFIEKEIKQLVLIANDSIGPAIDECIEPCYKYKTTYKVTKEAGVKGINGRTTRYVPKCCYRPLIDPNIDKTEMETIKQSPGYQLLEKVWEYLNIDGKIK